ncbi:MAG: hypothetical protein J5959_09525 [Butyrivibrio sp.]|nr:hypothetical protein [Butyrivibrio sp.]
MNKTKKKSGLVSIPLILIAMLLVVTAFVALTYFEMQRYEDGILDVCATQQDSYVQLVIDQINLKENRTDQEIIESILSTLDSSSNRYWTFSKDQTMLYVKDALETNRYQALTANSYYTTDSSMGFINDLELNKVKHERIFLDNKEYIASGALFDYEGEQYRICLLTNTTVLLDNNKFLGSKMELIIIFVVVYSAIFVLPIVLAIGSNKNKKKVYSTEADLKEANNVIEVLNEKMVRDEIYDNRLNLFNFTAIEKFLEEYNKQIKAFPISFIAFRYGQKETVSNFFGANCILFGKRDIKFYDGKNHLALIMSVKCDNDKAKDIAKKVKADAELLSVETARSRLDIKMVFDRTMRAMGNPEIVSMISGDKPMRPDSRTESRFRSKEDKS